MAVVTSAGSTLGISSNDPATYDVAGYAALTFTAIGEITDLGEFGRQYNLVTHNPIASRGTQKFKGSFNEGTMSLTMALDTDDAGQVATKAAVNSDSNFSFKLTHSSGDVYYFQAKVMSFRVGVSNVDAITTATVELELTTNSAGVGVVESLAA
jgi:hypothetical protein